MADIKRPRRTGPHVRVRPRGKPQKPFVIASVDSGKRIGRESVTLRDDDKEVKNVQP